VKNERRFLGMPMNWEPQKIFKTVWNKEDDRLFPPKAFGIGWTVNFHAVLRKTGLIDKNINSKIRKQSGDAND
jgi:hypothetical protein